jgi:hypothetical protein
MARKKTSARAKPAKKKRGAKKAKTGARKVKAVAKRSATKSARKPVKAKARKAASRAGKKKEVLGEGNYTASRNFRKQETAFVQRNKRKIPALGKAAEKALEGPEGADLRAAEAEARSHSMPED